MSSQAVNSSALIDAIESLVIAHDMRGRVVLFNHACEQITGLEQDEVRGRPLYEVLPELARVAGFSEVAYEEIPHHFTSDLYAADGDRRLVTWRRRSLVDQQNRIRQIILTGQDITEQRLGEEQLMINSEHQEVLNNLLYIGLEESALDYKLERVMQCIHSLSWTCNDRQAGIFLLDDSGEKLVLQTEVNMPHCQSRACATLNVGECMCGVAAASGHTQHTDSMCKALALDATDREPNSVYSIPVKSGERVLGVMFVYFEEGHTQDVREIVFLRTVANTIAGLVERHKAQESLSKSQSNLLCAQRIAHIGSWEWDSSTGKLYCSDEANRILDMPADEGCMDHRSFIQRLHPDDKYSVLKALRRAIKSGNQVRVRHRICNSQSVRHVVLNAEVSQSTVGNKIILLGTLQDVSEQLAAEQELKLVASVFDGAQESIMVTDAGGNILRVNQAFTDITGYSADEVIGQHLSTLAADTDAEFFDEMQEDIVANDIWRGEIWSRKKDGTVYPEWKMISTVKNERDEVSQLISISMDITEKKDYERHIFQLAHYDTLTKLPNRVMLESRLAQAVALSRRQQSKLAILFLDLDGLKRVNDSMGHNAGDELLKCMGDRVRQCVREEDIVARWGGDEFVIVLSDIKQTGDVVYIANMILDFLSEPLTLGDKERVVISTSIGISLYPADGDAPKQLIENADMAMYKAKQSGGNCYQFYTSEMNVAVIERLSMETGLRTALEMNHFELYYQPLLDMQSQQIIGAEALLRWNHPKKGLIPPDKFIPVAEDSGLIIPIGEWVVNEACRQCHEWHEQQLTDLKINVNLSARQFRDNNLVSMINDALQHSGLDPAYLTLEITESSAMENARETISGLQTLKNVGIHLSIDDFGTGYSSLAYLKRFPIDTLKIDRSFVKDIDRDSDDRAIVRSIIAMGHSLNLAIVAEGVEKVEHINYLNEQYCDVIQGYFISKPLTNDDFVAFVRRQHSEILMEHDSRLLHAPAMSI